MEVRIQSVVVEFILNNVDVLFSAKLSSLIREGAGEFLHNVRARLHDNKNGEVWHLPFSSHLGTTKMADY